MKTAFCKGFVDMTNLSKSDKIMIEHGYPVDTPKFRPYCQCGWNGELCCDVAEARNRIAAHLLENPITLR